MATTSWSSWTMTPSPRWIRHAHAQRTTPSVPGALVPGPLAHRHGLHPASLRDVFPALVVAVLPSSWTSMPAMMSTMSWPSGGAWTSMLAASAVSHAASRSVQGPPVSPHRRRSGAQSPRLRQVRRRGARFFTLGNLGTGRDRGAPRCRRGEAEVGDASTANLAGIEQPPVNARSPAP